MPGNAQRQSERLMRLFLAIEGATYYFQKLFYKEFYCLCILQLQITVYHQYTGIKQTILMMVLLLFLNILPLFHINQLKAFVPQFSL